MTNVFTYGTLQVEAIWRRVAREHRPTLPGVAHGYSIRRVRGADYPAMFTCPDDSVPGLIYVNVGDAALARLDRFEGALYTRREVRVEAPTGDVLLCDAYLLADGRAGDLTDEPWLLSKFLAGGGPQRFTSRYAGFHEIEGD